MAYAGGFDHEKLDVYRLSIEFQRWLQAALLSASQMPSVGSMLPNTVPA